MWSSSATSSRHDGRCAIATVTTPYTMVDGAVLDPAQYTDDIYDPSVAGRGILSEPNGRLSATNLAGGFLVQAEHIQPGELFRSAHGYETEPVDFYDDGGAVDNEADDTAPTRFIPIYGAACRIYVPYRCLLLWQWEVFVHPWLVMFDDVQAATGNRRLEGFIVANIGGATVNHTRRRLTHTVMMQNTAGSAVYGTGDSATPGRFQRYEDRGALNYGMHHVEAVSTVGYREMSVRLFLENSDEVANLQRPFFTVGAASRRFSHRIHTRASFGIRSCWVIGYHMPA